MIKKINNETLSYTKSMNVLVEINGKKVPLIIHELFNSNTECIEVDWDYEDEKQTEPLTEEEQDEIFEWVNSFGYN